MKRLVIIQLGDRAMRNAMDKLGTQNKSAAHRREMVGRSSPRWRMH